MVKPTTTTRTTIRSTIIAIFAILMISAPVMARRLTTTKMRENTIRINALELEEAKEQGIIDEGPKTITLDSNKLNFDFDNKKDYIFFVDDANRIDIFSQITGFYKSQRTGNLKIILTARDYALPIVEKFCFGFEPKQYVLKKFNKESCFYSI